MPTRSRRRKRISTPPVEIYAADGYHLRRTVGDVLDYTDRHTWVAIGVSVLAALVFTMILTRAILPPVRAAVRIAQTIAAGTHATIATPRGRSETADLLRALGIMQAAIVASLAENRQLLDQQAAVHAAADHHQAQIDAFVQRFGRSIAGVFKIVAESSAGMTKKADGLLVDADALLASERDMSHEIEQVVARIAEASIASKALSEAIVGIREEAAQTEQRAKAALEETHAASVQMHTLDSVADEIAAVVAIIGSVASETKMLALNAAIEAARAGGGRGRLCRGRQRGPPARPAQRARGDHGAGAYRQHRLHDGAAARASITAIDTLGAGGPSPQRVDRPAPLPRRRMRRPACGAASGRYRSARPMSDAAWRPSAASRARAPATSRRSATEPASCRTTAQT